MNTAIIELLDRELPQLRGTERDELAAKIAALIKEQRECPNCRSQRRRRGRK